MATHSSTLARRIPWQRSLVGYSPWGRTESDTIEPLHFHFSLSCIGEGNGNPLQYSCLENPGMGEHGGLPSMGSHRVRHDWSDLAAAAAASLLSYVTTDHSLYAPQLWSLSYLILFTTVSQFNITCILKEIIWAIRNLPYADMISSKGISHINTLFMRV